MPFDWDGFSYTRIYRGIKCEVSSPKLPKVGAEAKALVVDGEEINGTFIPFDKLSGKKSVKIEIKY